MPRNSMIVAVIAGLVLCGFALNAWGAPADGAEKKLYYLKIEVKTPRPLKVDTPDGPEIFWYVEYQVVNSYDEAIEFFPQFTVITEDKKVYQDGNYYWAKQALMKRFDRKNLKLGAEAAQVIPAGKKIQGFAVFKEIDKAADRLYVRVRGLTNDYYLNKEKDKDGVPVFRVYQIEFDRPGDNPNIAADVSRHGPDQWVFEDDLTSIK